MGDLRLPDGPLHVVGLAAHPDDLEIALGGTLLRLAERGQVTMSSLTMTGSPGRAAEARAAAEAFLPGTRASLHEFTDGRLPARWDEVKSALHAYAREHPAPDLVFAPRPDDAHQDHRLLGVMAPTVWRTSLVMRYEIPKWDGDLGRPTTYVEVPAEVARRKIDLLNACFPSQHSHDWWDDELFLGFMRMRGMETRTRYSEAFEITKARLDLGGPR